MTPIGIRDLIMLHEYISNLRDQDKRTKDAEKKLRDEILSWVEGMRRARFDSEESA